MPKVILVGDDGEQITQWSFHSDHNEMGALTLKEPIHREGFLKQLQDALVQHDKERSERASWPEHKFMVGERVILNWEGHTSVVRVHHTRSHPEVPMYMVRGVMPGMMLIPETCLQPIENVARYIQNAAHASDCELGPHSDTCTCGLHALQCLQHEYES